MPEGLTTADGQPIDLEAAEQDFHRAMAAPEPDERPEYPSPPRRDPATPKADRPRKTSADKPRTARSVPASPRGSKKPEPVDRKGGVDGLLQITAGVLMVLPATQPDAAALGMHGENLGAAIVATADADERFGRALDKLLRTGPYTALVMAAVPLAVQIAANHKLVPAGFMGTEDPAKLRQQVAGLVAEQEPARAA